ncbi:MULTISPECIES: sensor histidine kinase [Caloramator]|uniref:histidine kinase n=2 Tax=Caloramator TaxID=44258 RepID=G0V4F2_9CLOT|nr:MULTISPECIES: histidine kinase [Caloramator]MDO6356002.1 histidine kinase [Caloramator sp. CAR-1]CCC57992.1 Two-component sensor histidine kinase [Caloramator australicus RC3]
MNKEIFKFLGIRKRLIIYFLFTIFLLTSTSFFSFYTAKVVINNTNSIINDYIYLNELKYNINGLMTELEKYLTTASSENLLNYYNYYNRLQEISNQISRTLEYDNKLLILMDIGNMLDELLRETDKAVLAKRGRISSRYISNFQRSIEISEYINQYYDKLLDSKLKTESERYQNINKNMSFVTYLSFLTIIISIFLSLYIAIMSTYRLTKPISDLSNSAEKVAKGHFDIEIYKPNTGDETDILAGAFIKMVDSIKNYINELKKQAEVEKRLKEQELQNIKMASLLKEAELKFLQSQINPHFLFNTLNAASQLAMIEGSDKASEFIENIAQLFRYNLKNIDDLVPLRDEIEHVKNYMGILKMRFGNRIEFFSDIDEGALDVKVPRITLQPIVENAYVHGLQNLERPGEIHLNVKSMKENIIIEIIDNGMGMDEDTIQKILLSATDERLSKKHVTGIGMNNVLERLEILFDIQDRCELISIESKLGYGTKITLRIPKGNSRIKDVKVC